MAETILFGLAETLLQNLGSRASQEIGLAWAVKDEIQKLNTTVSTIKDVLLDAEEQSIHNRKITNWLQKLQDAIYDADDLLDHFSATVLQQQVRTQNKLARKVCIFFSSSNQIAFGLKMGQRIKAIRERLDELARVKNQFILTDRPAESIPLKYRPSEQTHSFVLREEVIGREDDKNKIMDLLLESNPVAVGDNVSVIPIVGIGGLGKTTFAQYVYNDEKIGEHFVLKMWVCVSNDFNVKRIVENVLESSTQKKPERLQMDALQICLREEIGGKKYLLVLDDVWNENFGLWRELKNLLMVGASGSKIIVTTRSHRVAEITDMRVQPYILKGLDEERSWDLFKKIAFQSGGELQNPEQVEIGKEIVRKCSGVPLAIRTLGSLLYSHDTKYWLSIKHKEFSNIDQKENDIIPILRLSYDDLPSYLKHCFAYCSVYPKDFKIKKRTLIQLWVANGFVHSEDGNQCAEEIGDQYFIELLRRSFFQDVKRNERDDGIKSCKMHDLMHDLAVSVAGERICSGTLEAVKFTEKTRHLSFHYESEGSLREIPSPFFNAGKLRTFLLPSHSIFPNIEVNETCCRKLISRFRCLRVLDLHGQGIEMLPGSIWKLKQLRYLDLSRNGNMKRLPESITLLVNLQTLKLSVCRKLEELPRDIKNLVNLVHLYLDDCMSLKGMPHGVGQLSYLRMLSDFVVGEDATTSSGLSELKGLNNLEGRLSVVLGRKLKNAAATSGAILKEKQHLRELYLKWKQERNGHGEEVGYDYDYASVLESLQPHPSLKKLEIFAFGGRRWSNWMMHDKMCSLLPNLVDIRLRECHKCQHLPPFGQLPHLKFLSLYFMGSVEYMEESWKEYKSSTNPPSNNVDSYCCLPSISAAAATEENANFVTGRPFFPALEELRLSLMENLKGWWREEVADSGTATATATAIGGVRQQQPLLVAPLLSFPRLMKLEIRECPKLTSMPLCPSVEDLYLEEVDARELTQQLMKKAMTTTSALTQESRLIATVAASSSSSFSLPSSASFISSFPFSNLRSLYIRGIGDLESLPEEWPRNLTSLQSLGIDGCPRLLTLGDEERFRGLTSLQSLYILECDGLKALPLHAIQHLISLEALEIKYCKEMELSNDDGDGDDEDDKQWENLNKSLSSVKIAGIPKMVCLPKWLQHSTSLCYLYISRCDCLKALPLRGIQHLISLEVLEILYCKELEFSNDDDDDDEDGKQWENLNKNLCKVRIGGIPKMVCLPKWLQHSTSLQNLCIHDCPGLRNLPEWMGNLTSFQELHLCECPQLESLPDWMCSLTTMQFLHIYSCPILEERCKKDTGEDWPKIAHIPPFSRETL
ncbi:putative disease resistance protein RGA3 [Malania oleifera]|uniref:putative disease resistance protein RGA3 n=1 Tax=Malania oleifera TaxID=397392 RepID=UPI0025AE60C5|nr:putative disease resistance protein RGA3 [Malania oleifera]XP_057976206.1 putative disease resistance protein RGA3 [Malania oleifera]XP_057976207.1 putative disease resistance protein RGA3 [Malania oleifera]